MKRSYHGRKDRAALSLRLDKVQGQLFLPIAELLVQARTTVTELIDQVTQAAIEAVLEQSAEQVAGPRSQGRRRREVVWHGHQPGRVCLADRKLRVNKPRLRRRTRGGTEEIELPAYRALQDEPALGSHMLEILLRGVSTRQYEDVLTEITESVGISRSAVSRRAIRAATVQLEVLLSRRFEDVDLLVIYIDGMVFGSHHVIAAVGVDAQGNKHVLGVQHGATENAAAVQDLLEGLIARGVTPDRRRLFVIDGAKALRAAITRLFGDQPVQRCRNHKIRNVSDRLPKEERERVVSAMRMAYRMDDVHGIGSLERLGAALEPSYPAAAASLMEGLEECFTINRLHVPRSLHRCLASTNLIESPQAGVRARTRRICRWHDPAMVLRWVAAAFLMTEKSFRVVMGYRDLPKLRDLLRPSLQQRTNAQVA